MIAYLQCTIIKSGKINVHLILYFLIPGLDLLM